MTGMGKIKGIDESVLQITTDLPESFTIHIVTVAGVKYIIGNKKTMITDI